jgi:hypothetical protein
LSFCNKFVAAGFEVLTAVNCEEFGLLGYNTIQPDDFHQTAQQCTAKDRTLQYKGGHYNVKVNNFLKM